MKHHLLRHEAVLLGVVIAAFAVLSMNSPFFLAADNLLNQAKLSTELGLIAIAMTFVIVSGGIDLSVGSIMGLTAVILGYSAKVLGLPMAVSIPLALSVAGLAGLFNGLLITRFALPPLIATLGTLALYRGLAEGISQGRSLRGFPAWFTAFGNAEPLGVPVQVWVLVTAATVAAVTLGRTVFGRTVYAVGASEPAARFSGLATQRARLIVYTGSGLAAGLAGVLFVSRVATTRSDMGSGMELDAITAVVLGGTSIFGGKGTVIGTILGLTLIQSLRSGLAIIGVRGDSTVIAIGAILIVAARAGR